MTFIDTNTASEALQSGLKSFVSETEREMKMRRAMTDQERVDLDLYERTVTSPHRIAAAQTELDSKRLATEAARLGLTEAQATTGDRIRQTQQATEQGDIATKAATTALDVNQRTANDVVAQVGQKTQAGEIAVESAKREFNMQGFKQSLDLLIKGQPQAAVELARRYGDEIPPEIVKNREFQLQMAQVADQADRLYPSRPRDQQAFIEAKIAQMTAQNAQGQPNVSDPRYPAQLQDGTGQAYPVPPEQAGKSAGKKLQFEVIYNMAKQLRYSDQEAFDMARGIRAPQGLDISKFALDIVNSQYPPNNPRTRITPEERATILRETVTELQKTFQQQPRGPSSAVPPPVKPGSMAGTGTEQDPFVPTTQEQIDNLPAGAVFSANGKVYRKQ